MKRGRAFCYARLSFSVAGAVVTLKDIPPGGVVAGNPARILKSLPRIPSCGLAMLCIRLRARP